MTHTRLITVPGSRRGAVHGLLVSSLLSACPGTGSGETDITAATTGEPATTTGAPTTGGPSPEEQPAPAEGGGLSDPPTNTLHNHLCAGIDWQRIHGWLLLPHAAPELGPPGEMERCVERYAGWVTNEADAAVVSRASVEAERA